MVESVKEEDVTEFSDPWDEFLLDIDCEHCFIKGDTSRT